MSSAPVVPSTPVTPAKSTVTPVLPKAAAVSDIVVQHHPIIKLVVIAALIGFSVWFLAGKIETAWANHEAKVYDAKNAALAAQVTQNAALAATTAADAAKEAQLAAQYQALLQQTNVQIANLQAQLKKQQAADAAMTPSDLATHWNALIKSAAGVHPVLGGGYTVDQDAAVTTTQALDSIPELNAEIANDGNILAKSNTLIAGDEQEISDLDKQVTGLQAQNSDEVTTCNAQVGALKASQAVELHKAKKNWFIHGLEAAGAIFIGAKLAGI